MQSLTPEQGDALLDLIDQCHLVHHTFEQSNMARGSGDSLTVNRHAKAMKRLTDIYVQCDFLGIDQNLLMHQMVCNLPEDLSVSIDLPAA